MIVFRLSKAEFAYDLSGKGAEISGGRWNSKGVALLYTSDSRALCTAEIAVHTPLGIMPTNYQIISIEIPENSDIEQLTISSLPYNWRSFPHSYATQEIGNNFVKAAKFLILKVPSAIVQGEFNYLINPMHKNFKKIKIISILSFNFDERLFLK
ncbi:MAG: RES domain-containing protein [Sphingobacteriales bacterium]|nr:MAG: RES domain-containing protein [Sphingobacteriales bacterium]TAF82420.1 MAG: RES domain-containing protein [Sphingobacteriales bacterium]